MIIEKDNLIAFWSEKGQNGFCSQWYMCPIVISGVTFCCNEQYMMYSKAILFKDDEVSKQIMATKDPREIKALGRLVKNFDKNIWGANKERIVYEANYAKFTQNNDLKALLLSSGDKIIVEASPRDCIWGIGRFPTSPSIYDTDQWRGLNLLGKAIMKVRDEIRNK